MGDRFGGFKPDAENAIVPLTTTRGPAEISYLAPLTIGLTSKEQVKNAKAPSPAEVGSYKRGTIQEHKLMSVLTESIGIW